MALRETLALIVELVAGEDYDGAYDVATNAGASSERDRVFFDYYRAACAARMGRSDEAIQILGRVVEAGLWYGEEVLRHSPSFASLQGLPDFESVAAASLSQASIESRATGEGRDSPRIIEVGQPSTGIVIALHGNYEDGAAAAEAWSLPPAGWGYRFLDSRQAMGSYMRVWDDPAIAQEDVVRGFTTTIASDPDAPYRVIAGFSMGGETALRSVLTGAIVADGVLMICPGGPSFDDPSRWTELLPGPELGVRGWMIAGELDHPEQAEGVVRMLNDNGLSTELRVVPGMGHSYPSPFGPYIIEALAVIAPSRDTTCRAGR